MACPTCSHTMTPLFQEGGRRHFYCERCGTLKTEAPNAPDHVTVPKLGLRVRETLPCATRLYPDGSVYAIIGRFWVAICEAIGAKEPSP